MRKRTGMEISLYEIGRRVKHVRDGLTNRSMYLDWLGEIGMNEETACRLIEVSERMQDLSYKPSDKELLELTLGWGGH